MQTRFSPHSLPQVHFQGGKKNIQPSAMPATSSTASKSTASDEAEKAKPLIERMDAYRERQEKIKAAQAKLQATIKPGQKTLKDLNAQQQADLKTLEEEAAALRDEDKAIQAMAKQMGISLRGEDNQWTTPDGKRIADNPNIKAVKSWPGSK